MRLWNVRVSRRPPCPSWAVAVVVAWVALGGAAAYAARLAGVAGVLCSFKLLTGLPCPTCGAGRGAAAALEGRWAEAWACNPLIFTALVLGSAVLAGRVVLGRAVRLELTGAERAAAWCLAAGAVLFNWVYVILYVG